MPSLFSRSRTTSTPSKKSPANALVANAQPAYDEFGRVNSRGSGAASPFQSPLKKDAGKDKKKAGQDAKSRTRTLSSPRQDHDLGDLVAQIPDGSFLLLNLDRPRDESGEEKSLEHDYGYLSCERHVILGLDDVARLVDVLAVELGTRCLTTPFIFSTLALDISSSAIKRLIRAFLETCANPSSQEAEHRWREEARFAGPHELGMCFRWGFARVVRVVGGQAVRGLISWDHYVEFRDSEAALNYPPTHFATFLPPLPPVLRTILWTLLSLLIRFTAHSSASGHTPPTLSPLFGPLLFGLGPASLSFQHTYIHYLRAVNAMEHIMLAFIRCQDAPKAPGVRSDINTNITFGSATTLGVPTRLKDWIRGYPSMLPTLHVKEKQDKPQARRGARTMRVVSVRRNVRMYSPDLVKTAAGWASAPRFGQDPGRGLAGSKEWERIAPSALKLQPRYSEGYKKRMDMPASFHPYTGPTGTSSATSSTSSATSKSSDEKDKLGLGFREGEDRFRTLTELKWGEFENSGFGTTAANDKKLQFDLTESERTSRSTKRTTMNWNDFSAIGFDRTDARLSATLQFSTPVAHSISSWPMKNESITKKLKKTQRALPPFGWDTEPVMGSEEMIEEAFMDVFCDLVYGGGWMDIERGEETDRECNWALIAFKSLPLNKNSTPGGDPRTAATVLLFEEFVPLEYRQQLAKESGTKRRLPFLFSPSSKSRPWKPAATLNGRPYVVGHVPKSPTLREVEFEGMLRSNGSKILSLSKAAPAIAVSPATQGDSDHTAHSRPGTAGSGSASPARQLERVPSDSPLTPGTTKRRFRIPVPSPSVVRRSTLVPAEYSTVDFETRLASYSDDELNESASMKALTPAEKNARRMSRDDAWVDILVAAHSRRMGSQEADRRPGGKGLKGGRSDPELASQEIALVLAGVRARSPLSDEEEIQSRQPAAEVLPNTTPQEKPKEGQDPDIESVMSYPKNKRVGYFDLHPERRPGGGSPQSVRPQVNANDSDGDDVPDHLVYGALESIVIPAPDPVRPSFESEGSEYGPSATSSPTREIDVPEFVEYERSREEKESSHSRAESTTLPQLTQSNDFPKSTPQSKTASLIEMYREREKQTLTSAMPSKLPVRSAPLPPKNAELPPIPPSVRIPSPVSVPESDPPEIGDEPEPEADYLSPLDPNHVLFAESGRNSPGRYIHGAPLHNVVEEEEEED
ncbi:hypothetical protein L210DRAFT_3638868 [Boletus edulis BED1]|uniref:Meiotically up-regulated protein Msb1/Mug8 domain-containing protein n=1 Tax=Boletus edulis BED1 TaxID=1328754 RepID=A0AAD4C9A4_BOLED|nr:hypothetical protein L210DRAFT_3638868 [Boletus edulis BED1]